MKNSKYYTNVASLALFGLLSCASGSAISTARYKVPDWNYKGATYYKAIRDPLINLCSRLDDADRIEGVSYEEIEKAYLSLPNNIFDYYVVTLGKGATSYTVDLPGAKQDLAREPDVPESQFDTCIGFLIAPLVPVRTIFAKTKEALAELGVPNDLKQLAHKQIRTTYGSSYSLRYLFEDELAPITPGGKEKPTFSGDILDRRKEFYGLINNEDMTTVVKYLLFVMSFVDGAYVGLDFSDHQYLPYRGAKLDKWQQAWNKAIPALCDVSEYMPQGPWKGCPRPKN